MATVAAVDIGTNSVKLTIAQNRTGGGLLVLHDATAITRLGKNVDASGQLDPEAVSRTLEALGQFAVQAQALGAAGHIAAVGTSALRDAANGSAFVEQAKQVLGGTVEVISGEREAHLTYTAARLDPDLNLASEPTTTLATIDIGGGSTELVLGRGDTLLYRGSLQMGAVRLTERALSSDPPTMEEQRQAAALVDASLAGIVLNDGVSSVTLVGSGGTVANLANMERNSGLEAVHGTRLTREQIEARIQALAELPLAERRTVPGLEPDRADVIVAGAIILVQAMNHLGAGEMIASARGLRYGLLYELMAGAQSE